MDEAGLRKTTVARVPSHADLFILFYRKTFMYPMLTVFVCLYTSLQCSYEAICGLGTVFTIVIPFSIAVTAK